MGDVSAVVFGRNFAVWSAPFLTANALPADTVDWGAAWPTGFVNRGYTNDGLTINMGITRGEIRVDQELDPIAQPVTARAIRFQTSLAEMTPANLQLASGLGSLVTVAPATSTRGHVDLEIHGSVADVYNSWGFDIQQQDTMPFRAIIFRGLAVANPTPKFEPANPANTALDVAALVDSSTSPSRVATIRDVLPPTG